ncbi:MAG: hypothetical protein GY910_06365 [bacterium]|nr:hypothetical protein [Deltaproteobacteria bacterium]MCP4904586.1 hypothetical protein [bacterium]
MSDQEDREPDPREEDGDAFPGVDELLASFLSEGSLLPVLIVALGSGGAFGAALLILTIVDRNPFAGVALLLVAGMTVDVSLRARREEGFRNIKKFVGLLWASSLAFSALALWTGIAFR